MVNEKLVSIVLPIYNGASHMSDAIESVLSQTYKNWELIIVNDCSTDNTLEVAKDYQKRDPRIYVISNEKNLKLPSTLNVGFSKAKGEYYTWTSDDNIYKPDALAKLVKELDEDSGCLLVYSDYTNIDAFGNEIGPGDMKEPRYIVTGNIIGACFLYRAEVAKKVGEYDANLFLAEDYDYWIRIYRIGKIKHLKERLYLYRRHQGSLSETRKESVNMQTYKVIEKNFFILYANAKKYRLKYRFFDQMVDRVSSDLKIITRQMLYDIDGGYKLYQWEKGLKDRMYKGFIGNIWRKMKGIG